MIQNLESIHSPFILTGFADEISPNAAVQITEMQKMDIAYIEVRGVNGKSIVAHTLEEVVALKEMWDAAGIKISAIGSPIGKVPIEDPFEPHLALFQHTVQIAKLLGTRFIRLFSFFMQASDTAQYRDEVIRRLKQMVDLVSDTEIILLHENEKDIFGDVPERCLDLVESIASPHFKLIFDPANFIQCHVETLSAYEMLKQSVVYFHIKDALRANGTVVPPGGGDGQLSILLKRALDNGFAGFLSLEPHLGAFTGFSTLERNQTAHVGQSDTDKFRLAYEHLVMILREVQA